MLRFGSRLIPGLPLLALLACGPSRDGFDVNLPDVMQVDVAVDTRADVEASMDAHDATMAETGPEGGACNDDQCDNQCLIGGCAGGVCREGACSCLGCADVFGVDARDVQYESSVIGCSTSTECPASEFCSGIGCTGTGFCFPREDPAMCTPDPTPSCGCDGTSYTSVCARLAAGVRLNPAGCGVSDAAVDAAHTDARLDSGG